MQCGADFVYRNQMAPSGVRWGHARGKSLEEHSPTTRMMHAHLSNHPIHSPAPPLGQIDPKKDVGKRLVSFDGDADRIVYHYFDAEVRG